MSVHDVSNFEVSSNLDPVLLLGDNVHCRSHVGSILLLLFDDVGSRMKLRSVKHILSHQVDVVVGDPFRVRQFDSNFFWNRNLTVSEGSLCNLITHLVDSQIRIWPNDCTTGEIDTFTGQVSTESTLFTLQSLHKTSCGFSLPSATITNQETSSRLEA